MIDSSRGFKTETEYEGLHQLAFRAMGSSFDLWVASDRRESARQALTQARDFIDEAEQVMSRFRDDSDLVVLNRSSGRRTTVNPLLFEAVSAALDASRRTNGLYDPTVLSAMIRAGYDRDFERITETRLSSINDPALHHPVPRQSWSEIELVDPDRSITLPSGIQIDLGGIGKAWAARKAADIVEEAGPCIVSGGGDIAVRGEPYPGEGWLVAINDPHRSGRLLTNIEVTSCGIATSGTDRRRWTQDGTPKHHIIDPRTGLPAVTDLVSVTVIAPDVLVAERLALSAMVLGSERAVEVIESEPDCEALLVLDDVTTRTTQGFNAHSTGKASTLGEAIYEQ